MNILNPSFFVGVLIAIFPGTSCSRQIGYAHRPTDEIITRVGKVRLEQLDAFRINSVLFVPSVGGDEMSGDGVIRFHLDVFSSEPKSVELVSIEIKSIDDGANGWLVDVNKIITINERDPRGQGFAANLILLDNLPVTQRRNLMENGSFLLLINAKVGPEMKKLEFRIDDDTKHVVP